MHTTTAPAQTAPLPITLHRPTATLTPKGHAVLGLIREQDALPAGDRRGRARLDTLIAALLSAPALAEERMRITGPMTTQKEPWL